MNIKTTKRWSYKICIKSRNKNIWKVKKNISLWNLYDYVRKVLIISFQALIRSYGYLNQFQVDFILTKISVEVVFFYNVLIFHISLRNVRSSRKIYNYHYNVTKCYSIFLRILSFSTCRVKKHNFTILHKLTYLYKYNCM